MPGKGLGAVAHAFHAPLGLVEGVISDPERGEVLVQMRASPEEAAFSCTLW
jgi:Zn-dependent alcohol dehydrogenase